MNDRRKPGWLVLLLGVLLVALPSAIGFLSSIEIDQTLNLALSIAGIVLTVVGMVMYSRAGGPAS
jgi:drug/metabolite transporter (DMT)-like permease